MKTICLDPVTPQLLIAAHLSFVTVDRLPPYVPCPRFIGHAVCPMCSGRGYQPSWIDHRVAIYADKRTPAWLEAIWPPNLPADASKALQPYGERVVMDAIVGSGTLAEALPIRQGACNERTDHICRTRDGRLLIHRTSVAQADISDQLPLQDWSAGRWALRFTDVAPTAPRRKRDWTGTKRRVWLDIECPVVAPALSGDGTYREWTP